MYAQCMNIYVFNMLDTFRLMETLFRHDILLMF